MNGSAVTDADDEILREIGKILGQNVILLKLAAGIGMFLLSGSLWVAIEKFLSNPDGVPFPITMWFMMLSAFFGAVLLVVGVILGRSRRSLIKRLMSDVG